MEPWSVETLLFRRARVTGGLLDSYKNKFSSDPVTLEEPLYTIPTRPSAQKDVSRVEETRS